MLELIDKQQTVMANDFSAIDSENHLIKLSNYKGNKNVVLVFNRGLF